MEGIVLCCVHRGGQVAVDVVRHAGRFGVSLAHALHVEELVASPVEDGVAADDRKAGVRDGGRGSGGRGGSRSGCGRLRWRKRGEREGYAK